MIYKLLRSDEWRAAVGAGQYDGSDVDRADGFVHFSNAEQVVETARKWFDAERDITMLTVDADQLTDTLRWEPSRGGALFPHVYGPLPVSAVVAAVDLPADVPVSEAVAAVLQG